MPTDLDCGCPFHWPGGHGVTAWSLPTLTTISRVALAHYESADIREWKSQIAKLLSTRCARCGENYQEHLEQYGCGYVLPSIACTEFVTPPKEDDHVD